MLKPNEHERSEQELKALFQTMRQADAERAPSFAASLRAVPQRERLGYLRTLMGAMAAVVAVILLVAGVNAWRHGSTGESPAPTQVQAKAATVVPQATTLAPTRTRPARVGHALRVTQAAKAVPSITTWKSPTEALLKSPTDDLMTSVPSIGYTVSVPTTTQ